jgi:replicative DNA helicase
VASYEMTREQLFTAGLSRLAGLNSQQIEARAWTSPTLTTTQQQTLITEIQQAALTYQAEISPYLTIVEAGPEHTAAKLKGAIAHTRGQLGLTEADPLLVIVDYLQLLFTGDDRLDSGQNETLRVSRIATALKQLARDTKTAVIAISDITKEAYQKALASGSLDMSALRDSFKIAHAADSILLLQTGVINREGGPVDQLDLAALNAPQEKAAAIAQARSAYPLRPATKDGYARLSILKNRGGGLADPLFVYHKALHRFTPIDLPVAAQAGPDKDPGF